MKREGREGQKNSTQNDFRRPLNMQPRPSLGWLSRRKTKIGQQSLSMPSIADPWFFRQFMFVHARLVANEKKNYLSSFLHVHLNSLKVSIALIMWQTSSPPQLKFHNNSILASITSTSRFKWPWSKLVLKTPSSFLRLEYQIVFRIYFSDAFFLRQKLIRDSYQRDNIFLLSVSVLSFCCFCHFTSRDKYALTRFYTKLRPHEQWYVPFWHLKRDKNTDRLWSKYVSTRLCPQVQLEMKQGHLFQVHIRKWAEKESGFPRNRQW